MKKMMFNDRYGLTKAVLQGRKTVTRRLPNTHKSSYGGLELLGNVLTTWDCNGNEIPLNPPYTVGEIVAVAQSYFDIWSNLVDIGDSYTYHGCKGGFINAINYHYKGVHHSQLSGWTNKMFVKAELMPRKIRILDVRAEKLQSITEEDCLREGICAILPYKGFTGECPAVSGVKTTETYIRLGITYREAFATLINKISGRGTWETNPYVWRIEFELVK